MDKEGGQKARELSAHHPTHPRTYPMKEGVTDWWEMVEQAPPSRPNMDQNPPSPAP